jgi:hypothetical protein
MLLRLLVFQVPYVIIIWTLMLGWQHDVSADRWRLRFATAPDDRVGASVSGDKLI